jgi:hypothetical protein
LINMKYRSEFEIKGWDVAEFDGISETADMARATIRKAFTGELNGTSIGYGVLLQTQEQSGGYVVMERVTGTTSDGLTGSFVMQHYGIRDSSDQGPWYGHVIPGTGTHDFSGVTGSFVIEHGDGPAAFIWELDLPRKES